MRIPILITSCIIGLITTSYASAAGQSSALDEKTNIPTADTSLATFALSKNVTDLDIADRAIQAVDDFMPGSATAVIDPAIRKTKLRAYLMVYRLADGFKVPNFNPQDTVTLNVAPPVETRLPPGSDPNAIKDPKLRVEYQAAIQINLLKSEAANQEHQRLLLLQFMRQWIPLYLKDYFRHAASKQDAVNLLREYPVGGVFQGELEQALK